MTSVAAWLEALSREQRAQAEYLAATVRAVEPDVEDAVKWGRLTFTVEGDWHHWLCAISVTRSGVSLMLHKGALLVDHGGLLTGSGRYLRQLPYDAVVTQPGAVAHLLLEAVAHRTDMLEG